MNRVGLWRWIPILPGLALLPFLGLLPYAAYAAYSDLTISHYPNFLFLQRSLVETGTIPLWSPAILSGYPFAANPLSSLWYPPGWLALLFPLPLGLNLVTALHLILTGMGMFSLLRAEGLDAPVASLGGLAWAALPRLAGHFASGHVTLVWAVCWTPWLLLAARRAQMPRVRAAAAGAVFAAIILADPRWAPYAGLLWAGYQLRLTLAEQGHFGRSLFNAARAIAPAVGIAVLLAAPPLLPLVEYGRLSTRGMMGAADNLYLSLPPARLAGFLIPSLDGNTEWTVYPGAMLTAAFIWYALQPKAWRGGRGLWLLAAAAGVLLALGEHFPGGALLARVPGFNMLRVPPRALLVTGFALAVLVAHWLQDFSSEDGLRLRPAYFSRLGLAGAAGLTVLAALGVSLLGGEPPRNFWWGAGFFLACAAAALLRDAGRISRAGWVTAVFVLVLADGLGIGVQSIRFRSPASVLEEGAQVARWIAGQPGIFRVYSPDYSLPQQTAAHYRLEMVNGVDPLQLSAYAETVTQASGIPMNGYDVVLPPLPEDGSTGSPDAAALGLLNTRYVVSGVEIVQAGLEEAAVFGSTRIYENRQARPRAWVESSGQTDTAVTSLEIRPNRIRLTAEGPGTLVLSEISYPGWRVRVEGQPVAMLEHGILRAVEIQPGVHVVEFVYQPASVMIGLSLFAVGVVLLAVSMRAGRKS